MTQPLRRGNVALGIRGLLADSRKGPAQYAIRGLPLWTLILIILLASAALWGPGIVNTRGGGDSPFLLQRTHQLTVNLRDGVFPVRWMPDATYGLGYPFFNHYAALPFYLAALFHIVGFDLLTALKLTQTLGFVAAGLGMFGWVLYRWRRPALAWLAAVAYTVAPFHLVNVYVRGDSLSEFYAFAWYPLILWALECVVERLSIRAFILLGLSYAGLMLSHNLSAAIFSPFVLLYLALLVWSSEKRRPALGLGLGGLLLGVALAAWFWMPALLETRYVQSGTLTQGYFQYANHFRSANLVQRTILFDYDIRPSQGGTSPFAMGGAQALVALLGLVFVFRSALGQRGSQASRRTANNERQAADHRSSFIFVVIGLSLSTFMITPLSRTLWDHLPLLEMVQFPWRFLSVQALFAAIATGGLVLPLRGWQGWGMAGAIAVLLVASTLLPLRPERLPIHPDDVSTTRLQEYELFTGNIGTSITFEWLPRDVVPRFFTFDTVMDPEASPQAIPLRGVLEDAQQTQRRSVEQVWRVRTAEGGATLALPLVYWPGWRVWVDGEVTPAWAVESSGYLAVHVPAGEHTVRLKLDRTPLRIAAETLSLSALLTVLVLFLWRLGRFGFRITSQGQPHAAQAQASPITNYAIRIIPGLLIFIIGLLLFYVRSSPPPNRPDDLTMDFVAMPYLHHNPEGVMFVNPEGGISEDGVRLLSYTLSADRLAPGDTLTATVKWDAEGLAPNDVWVKLRLVSPAEHLPDNGISSYTLAEDATLLTQTTVHRLTVPESTPRGLYLLQLGLQGPDGESTARTPTGLSRGPLYLRPVRVTEGAPVPSDASVLALLGSGIRLHAARLEPTPRASNPSSLTVGLEWSAVRRMASNYKISVRLLDPKGDLRASTDTQPGYGFAPTSLWRPAERIADRYVLTLPDDLPSGEGFRLMFIFYTMPSLSEVARVELGPFALPLQSPVTLEPPQRVFELPPLSRRVDVDFTDPLDSASGDHFQLAGYDLVDEGSFLNLTLWWVAQRQPQADYTVFVHLFDPATETIVRQNDDMPRHGGYPTSGWLSGEVVSDTVSLALDNVPPGVYRLAIGLYNATTRDRLLITASDGTPLPDRRLILPDEIEVEGE